MKAPVPDTERDRLEALRALDVLDTPPEQEFDDLVVLAAEICDVPIARVTFVDAERQWHKASLGLPGGEDPRDVSLCAHAILGRGLLEVPDAREDPRFADNPLVLGGPQIRFYAGVPIETADGHVVGTLCVLDREPRRLAERQLDLLQRLGRQAAAILDRRTALASLAERSAAAHELAQLVDLAHDAIIVREPGGRIVSWNDGAAWLYGWSATEAVGRSSHELLETAFPSPLAEIEAELDAVGAWEGELRHVARDGSPRIVSSRWSLRDGKVMEVNRDVTERRRAESLLRAIIDEANDAYLAFDRDGVIREWNRAAERVFGWSREEALGRSIFETVVPDSLHEAARGALLEVARGRDPFADARIERTGRRRDGTEFPVEFTLWRPQGGTLLNVFAADVTQRVAAQEALEEQNARLLEVDRLKDEFVSLVSHELRTPLTSISGFVELLLGGEPGSLSEDQERFLEIIDRNAARLLRLVNDLLFVSQLEASALELESVDLDRVVRETVERLRPLAQRTGVELELEGRAQVELSGDAARLGQVVDNLVANAIKFTPAGGRVVVRVSATGDHCVVEVEDTGIGIPPSEQERLFERFFRTSSARERAIAGSGLGLTIAKAIVDAHGGSIGFESEAGRGTRFRVELPVRAHVAA